jgi:hypothetical protein
MFKLSLKLGLMCLIAKTKAGEAEATYRDWTGVLRTEWIRMCCGLNGFG